jgi:ElaB/YqjD/DUF883 family membrane-anchored ribosome-binding protein
MDAGRKLKKLMADTEELLDNLADQQGAKVNAVRERLRDSIEATKRAIDEQRRDLKNGNSTDDDEAEEDEAEEDEAEEDEASIGVRDLVGSLNDYVRRYPWLALATGVLVATTAGILATSATRRSYRR